MATVTYAKATRIYPGQTRPAVDQLDLKIADGEFLVLVGPSGCGKSTSLRMLAGLEEIDQGAVYIDETDVTNVPPKARDIAMVFQNYALYPHMTVRDNMAFSLQLAKMDKAGIDERVNRAAEILGLQQLLDRFPRQLSGGQRQRVAMGRAIVRQPQVFLFDEPLSNLDAKLRAQTRLEIQKLHRELRVTSLFVTHDQVEAMTLGQRLIVMNAGHMEQIGTPETVYARPATTFVAGFIGSPPMNLLRGRIDASNFVVDGAVLPLAAPAPHSGDVLLGLRPEHAELRPGAAGWPLQVEMIEMLGAERLVHGRLGTLPFTVRQDSTLPAPTIGATLPLQPAVGHLHWFDNATQHRI